MASQDWLTKDFYKVLGVDKKATKSEIKKAYHKLARTYHPDQNAGDPAAEEKFKEVGEAYSVLSDDEQRKQYDAIRAMGGGGPRFSPGGAGGFEDIFGGMFGGGARQSQGAGGFEDILSGMFRQGGGQGGGFGSFGGFGNTRRPTKGADVSASTSISFHDAVQGTTIQLNVGGKRVTARIPAGVTDGKKIRLRGKGQDGQHGGEAGDLIITVTVEKHPLFALKDKNILVTVPISFPEAALGANVEVPTIGGETVTVKIPAGTSSGKKLRVRGKGVAGGDMIVTTEIVVPRKLAGDAKEAVEAFAEVTKDADPRENFVRMAGV